jgi:hypothetical protein
MGLLVLIWAVTSPGGYFWPIWPMMGWGVALLLGRSGGACRGWHSQSHNHGENHDHSENRDTRTAARVVPGVGATADPVSDVPKRPYAEALRR